MNSGFEKFLGKINKSADKYYNQGRLRKEMKAIILAAG